jgi:hypothetical protein
MGMSATHDAKPAMSPAKARKAKTLAAFVEVYCRQKHHTSGRLCESCATLLEYALAHLTKCPFEGRKCKDCPVQCYQEPYRTQIREVMKFSGMHFVRRGRLDWLVRYFLGR